MSITVITPPALEPISLEEARAQVGVDGTAHDLLLAIYITSAREQVEQLIGRCLISRLVEQRLDAWPAAELQLEAVPAIAITSVKYDDPAGTEQTLAPEAYSLDAAAYPGGWLLPAAGAAWPATAALTNAVRIRYTAGFGASAASVPGPIRAWMLLAIGALFEQRSSVDASGKASPLPDGFAGGLIQPWRVY